jgi:Ca2+-binding RTX toxin-like protein
MKLGHKVIGTALLVLVFGQLAAKPLLGPLLPMPTPTTCGGKPITIYGTGGKDKIFARRQANVIHGMGGSDLIFAESGNDVICGGLGNDSVKGGTGSDWIFGGLGWDRLTGGIQLADTNELVRNTIIGGIGNDTIHGGNGNDKLYGSQGVDYLYSSEGIDLLDGQGQRVPLPPEGDVCYVLGTDDLTQNCDRRELESSQEVPLPPPEIFTPGPLVLIQSSQIE